MTKIIPLPDPLRISSLAIFAQQSFLGQRNDSFMVFATTTMLLSKIESKETLKAI